MLSSQALQIFWDPPFILTTSTYNKEIRHGISNSRGEGRVFEVSSSHCILHKCVVRFIRDNTKLLVLARIEDLGNINLPKAAKLLLSTIFTIAA